MQSASDYRAQARKCVEQAENAKSPKHRMILLQEAEVLLRMADEADLLQELCAGSVSADSSEQLSFGAVKS
jgi:hypothetical protein